MDEAEAIAVREAVQLAWEIGITEVEVEGDSLVICNALKDRDCCFAFVFH